MFFSIINANKNKQNDPHTILQPFQLCNANLTDNASSAVHLPEVLGLRTCGSARSECRTPIIRHAPSHRGVSGRESLLTHLSARCMPSSNCCSHGQSVRDCRWTRRHPPVKSSSLTISSWAAKCGSRTRTATGPRARLFFRTIYPLRVYVISDGFGMSDLYRWT